MYIVSAVLNVNKSTVALFDKEYKLLAKTEGGQQELCQLCLNVIAENGAKTADVDYIGVAVDGALGAPASVAAELEKNTGVKCYGASLIGAKALGEAYTAGDVPFLVDLKIDDKVECGIVVDKKIYFGMNQQEVNVSSMVIAFGGYECDCGRKGCFEAYASKSGLKRIAAEAGVTGAEGLTHKELFAMNTPEAECAKKLYVEYLSNGITNIINLFQPNEVVLEGPFTEVGDALNAPMMDIILREQYTHSMPNKCNIRTANTAVDTALLGAALLGR